MGPRLLVLNLLTTLQLATVGSGGAAGLFAVSSRENLRPLAISSGEVGRGVKLESKQLVSRGASGELIVNEAALRYLEEVVTQPCEVIAAVGRFHTGKSFLLNHLGRLPNGGFAVTNSRDPTTKGIHVWGAPLALAAADGSAQGHVLLLDTEGFADTQNSADYDAKVFSVCALLASQLVYNSRTVIDGGDIEYLELLARRAQLFSLKADVLGKDKSLVPTGNAHEERGVVLRTEEAGAYTEPRSTIDFPDLTWVIQSYYFDDPWGSTPTSWLQGLLQTTGVQLGQIFADVVAYTCIAPAQLRDWTSMHAFTPEQLDPEYLQQVDELAAQLTAKLLSKPGRRRTGAEIASLLRVLVDAANSGKMSHLPSVFALFAKQQAAEAHEAVMRILASRLATMLERRPPMTTAGFDGQAVQLVKEAIAGYDHALFHATDPAARDELAKLRVEAARERERASRDNDNSIQHFVQDVIAKAVEGSDKSIAALEVPQQSKVFSASLAREKAVAFARFEGQLHGMQYGSFELKGRKELAAGLELAERRAAERNSGELRKVYAESRQQAHTRFNTEMEKGNSGEADCLTYRALEQLRTQATSAAEAAFDGTVGDFAEELEAKRERSAALKDVPFDKFLDEARQCVKKFCFTQGQKAANAFDRCWAAHHPRTNPRDEAELQSMLADQLKSAVAIYDSAVQLYDVPSYREVLTTARKHLAGKLAEHEKRVRDENTAGWEEIFAYPLSVALDHCKDHAKAAYVSMGLFSFGVHSRVKRLCCDAAEREIMRSGGAASGAKAPSKKMRDQVICSWVETGEANQQLDKLSRGWRTIIFTILAGALTLGYCLGAFRGAPSPLGWHYPERRRGGAAWPCRSCRRMNPSTSFTCTQCSMIRPASDPPATLS